MAYSAIIKPNDYFNTKLYTGNGSSQTTTGLNFQPDFTWIKVRDDTEGHLLFDKLRGALYRIQSNNTSASTSVASTLTGWTSDGFSLGADNEVNGSGKNYVGWNWKGNGSGSANTDGSINSTVSASTTSGFSIVKWTGNGSTATIGHGLGKVPKMIIVKSLANTTTWMVQHTSLGNAKEIYLNGTNAAGNSTAWNSTTPTSTVFSVTGGAGDGVNASGDYIAYCFADIKGFSKFGQYFGNGNANGTFIYTGFKPAFVIVKASSISNEWNMWDNKRDPINVADTVLWSNTTNTEAEIEDDYKIDMLSNGFKARTADARLNQSGATYIYMAFAEEPLVSTNGNAATAR